MHWKNHLTPPAPSRITVSGLHHLLPGYFNSLLTGHCSPFLATLKSILYVAPERFLSNKDWTAWFLSSWGLPSWDGQGHDTYYEDRTLHNLAPQTWLPSKELLPLQSQAALVHVAPAAHSSMLTSDLPPLPCCLDISLLQDLPCGSLYEPHHCNLHQISPSHSHEILHPYNIILSNNFN